MSAAIGSGSSTATSGANSGVGSGELQGPHPNLDDVDDSGKTDESILERDLRPATNRQRSWGWVALMIIALGAAGIGVPLDPKTENMTPGWRSGMQIAGGLTLAVGLGLALKGIKSQSPRLLPLATLILGGTLMALGAVGAYKTDNLDIGRVDHLGVMALASVCTGAALLGSSCDRLFFRV